MTKRTAALLLLAAAYLAGAELQSRIQRAVAASPAARAAFWGIQVVDLDSGRTLAALNANRLFVPASNTKLFTTALGLVRLGPDYRYQTTVTAGGPPDAAGVLHGDVSLVGGGDPNLSARAIPYRPGPSGGNPLEAIEELAAQVAARGVRRIEGDVVGDDSAYVWEPFPEGWAVEDPLWGDGAPVSALTVNDNAFSLTIWPGARAGDLAGLSLSPKLEFYDIDNRIRTVARGERTLHIEREPGSRQLRLWGAIPAGVAPRTESLGIGDPALYGARAFEEALERHGVAVSGRVRVRHLFANQVADLLRGPAPARQAGYELARHTSPPLLEDLRVTAKTSQNLHAELTLRAVALARRGIGSRQAGLEEMKAFLDEIGIERAAYSLNDGSGLTRLNLVTPAAVVRLLRSMYQPAWRENWIGLLPIAGRDGTLEPRFQGTAAAGRIRAKTGTLTHVSALSGYADRRRGGRLAFSILVNNYNTPSGEARAMVDTICRLMLE